MRLNPFSPGAVPLSHGAQVSELVGGFLGHAVGLDVSEPSLPSTARVLSLLVLVVRVSRAMHTNDTAAATYPSADERDALVLEFQRLTARLVRAGLLSRASSSRLVRGVQRSRKDADRLRSLLSDVLGDVLVSLEDGTLVDREQVLRAGDGCVALHLDSVGPVLFRAKRGSYPVRELRRVFRFGADYFGDVVKASSARVMFGPDGDRRRAVVLDLARAYAFIGSRPPPVPVR